MGEGGENQHGFLPQQTPTKLGEKHPSLLGFWLGKTPPSIFFLLLPEVDTHDFWLLSIHSLAFQEQLLFPSPNHRPVAQVMWAPYSFTPDYKKRADAPGLTNRIISSLGCSGWLEVRHVAQARPKSAFGMFMGNSRKKKSFFCYWELPGITIKRETTWEWSQHRGKQKRDGKSLNHNDHWSPGLAPALNFSIICSSKISAFIFF